MKESLGAKGKTEQEATRSKKTEYKGEKGSVQISEEP